VKHIFKEPPAAVSEVFLLGDQRGCLHLSGIDASERGQSLGIAARDHLRSLINRGNGSIVVVPVEQDQYGRTVAELYVQPRSGLGYQAGEEIAVNAQIVACWLRSSLKPKSQTRSLEQSSLSATLGLSSQSLVMGRAINGRLA